MHIKVFKPKKCKFLQKKNEICKIMQQPFWYFKSEYLLKFESNQNFNMHFFISYNL